jgi:hypothetical protein
MTNPNRSAAIAVLIHHDCTQNGWDRTAAQVAEDMLDRYPAAREWELTSYRVAKVAAARGWTNRLRAAVKQHQATATRSLDDIEQVLPDVSKMPSFG